MSGKNWVILWALGTGGTAMALLQAAETPQLNVKLGLWEVSTHPQVSGDLPITDEQMQKLPPEQRAKFETAMRAALARGMQPAVFKECMTAEKRSRGFNAGNDQSKNCQATLVTNTPTEFESHRECSSEQGKESHDVHFRIVNSDHVSGTANMLISKGAKTMTVNSTFEANWLGADCGSVKDMEREKTAP